jgi:hypothetical protein
MYIKVYYWNKYDCIKLYKFFEFKRVVFKEN